MEIKQVTIENFRGIRNMTWKVGGKICCLIGPGDSTKTTILDAIDLALSPRWSNQFTDTDFYNGDIGKTIKVAVTVANLPDKLLTDEKFGLLVRGWKDDSGLTDEPEDDCELVLTIQMIVDSSLEPEWTIINDREKEGRKIGWKDRQLLGVARLGVDVDRHLSWGKGSALLKIANTSDDIASALSETNRQTRKLFEKLSGISFDEAALKAKKEANKFGVQPSSEYHAGLDTRFIYAGAGAISIHDGEVPLRMAGLGTKRLVALALEKLGVKEGAIILIDEIEHGLEPHRIRYLIRLLQKLSMEKSRALGTNDEIIGQIVMTSHSPTALVELDALEINVVRSNSGNTNIVKASNFLQDVIRKAPESFLSRKAIVCEGKTEFGICQSFEDYWSSKHDGLRPTCIGASLICGQGSEAARICKGLAELGYSVALFGDSDRDINPSKQELEKTGVKVIQWRGKSSTELRLFLDLPWEKVLKLIELAYEFKGCQSVVDCINNHLQGYGVQIDSVKEKWLDTGIDENKIRFAAAKAAEKGKWFKTHIEDCEKIGPIIISSLEEITNTDLAMKFFELEDWVYG